MIGGRVIQLVSNAPTRTLPIVGEIYPWQLTFFIVGALGLPIIFLMFTIREPLRRGMAARSCGSMTRASPRFATPMAA